MRALAVMALLAASAQASEPARCRVQLVHALPQGDGIDPKLERLKPYLEKAPFTAWKRFRLLEERTFEVAPEAPAQLALPGGKTAALTYVGHVRREDGKHRLRLKLEISDAQKKLLSTVFVLDEGGVFLEAGQKLDAGLLVLAFSCVTES